MRTGSPRKKAVWAERTLVGGRREYRWGFSRTDPAAQWLSADELPAPAVAAWRDRKKTGEQRLAAAVAPLRVAEVKVRPEAWTAAVASIVGPGTIEIKSKGFHERMSAFVAAERDTVIREMQFDDEPPRRRSGGHSFVVTVECVAVSGSMLTLQPLEARDRFSVPLDTQLRMCDEASGTKWVVSVRKSEPTRMVVQPIGYETHRFSMHAVFVLYDVQDADVTAAARLSALSKLEKSGTCMGLELMELLVATRPEEYARKPSQIPDVEFPEEAQVSALLGRCGYSMNASQLDAFQQCMARTLTLVQGPPGTGKSYFASRMIACLSRLGWPSPILVVCESNSAVDNLLSLLDKLIPDCRMLRVVKKIESPDMTAIARKYSLEEAIRAQQGDRLQVGLELLRMAQVVLSTNTSAAQLADFGVRFPFCLMDEGSAVSVASALVAMTLGVRRMTILGDHKQLPPFSKEVTLVDSFFEKFIRMGVKPVMLRTQYRMHPSIFSWSNACFYASQVETDASVLTSRPLPVPHAIPWTESDRVLFCDVHGHEERVDTSVRNMHEVDVVSRVVNFLCRSLDENATIGVISFYAAQVDAIWKRVPRTVTVATVDSFQGQERDIIIVSTVRSNGASVGFLADFRRWNVAMTRAKCALLVVGHRNTLRNDECINAWLSWERTVVIGERDLHVDPDRHERERKRSGSRHSRRDRVEDTDGHRESRKHRHIARDADADSKRVSMRPKGGSKHDAIVLDP